MEAFKEFIEEATGKTVEVRFATVEDANADF